MKVCFIGHKNIKKTDELVTSLKETVVALINKGATTFLFGSGSEFNDLSFQVVTELKVSYPDIKRVYVRSAYQKIDEYYEDYLLDFYEETYFPRKIENAGRLAYVERNYEMIDESAYCIFYYDESYVPFNRTSRSNMLLPSKRNSGTRVAYEYAAKKKKEIINLYK